jgi:4'-phosphopantetheinyl transferase
VDFELVVARLDEGAAGVATLATHLSPAERERASRLRFERDRRRYVVARGRLRELLGARLGKSAREVELVQGRNGKPMLAGGSLHFNVSHCDDLAVYGFSRARAIGVDLEALRAFSDADGIAARFFSPGEHAAYRSLPEENRTLGFYQCWTRKEAVVKALGGGLSLPLERFAVTLAPGDAARVVHIAGQSGDGGWRLYSFTPHAGYVAAAAIAPH